MLGNQTCSRFSYDYLSLKVLESYLSYGMSSILFKLFREKNGITYDVGVFNSPRRENSPFLIYLSVSNQNAFFAFQLLKKLWGEILSRGIKNEEMIRTGKNIVSESIVRNMLANYDNETLEVLKSRVMSKLSSRE